MNPATGLLDRSGESGLNTGDRYAVEAALQLRESGALGVDEVVAVTMGPESADRALRRALAMGCDRAIHLSDQALAGTDAVGTGLALSAVLGRERPGLVLLGEHSSDGGSGVMAGVLAEFLKAPVILGARSLTVVGDELTCTQITEFGLLTVAVGAVTTDTPAVVSVGADANTPRYASLKETMQAGSRPVEVLSCADVGIDPAAVGITGAGVECGRWHDPSPRAAGVVTAPESVDESVAVIMQWLEQSGLV